MFTKAIGENEYDDFKVCSLSVTYFDTLQFEDPRLASLASLFVTFVACVVFVCFFKVVLL